MSLSAQTVVPIRFRGEKSPKRNLRTHKDGARSLALRFRGVSDPESPGSWAVDGHLGGAGGLGLGASGLQDLIIPDPETLSPNAPRSTFGKMFPVKNNFKLKNNSSDNCFN